LSEVWRVTVAVAAVPAMVTFVGEKVQVVWVGSPEQESVTTPA
jgi:hypothetical protein